MDIPFECNSLKCINHPNEQIIFIKVNDLNNQNQIFYCEICIDNDDSFKPSNFLRIKNMISPDDNSFIHKWPSLDNSNITQKIIEIKSHIEKTQNLEQIIINYFDELKRESNSKIDHCQKSMLRIAREFPEQNQKILQKIKDLSKFDHLKNILLNNQLNNLAKQKQLGNLINISKRQKEQYAEQFMEIFKEFDQQNRKVNFERANTSKTQLFQLIDNLTFFDEINCENKYQIDFKNQINFTKQIENILLNLQMLYKKDVKITQNDKMEIKKLSNNQIEIINNKDCNYYSNLILDKNKKYIFRLSAKIFSFQNQEFSIGLIHDQFKELSSLKKYQFMRQKFQFSKDKQQLQLAQDYDFIKDTESDEDKMDEFMNIEIRIDQQNEIFEILDFPNNQQKLSLKDDFKKYLKNDHLRFYIYVDGIITATLTSAFIYEQFDNQFN